MILVLVSLLFIALFAIMTMVSYIVGITGFEEAMVSFAFALVVAVVDFAMVVLEVNTDG